MIECLNGRVVVFICAEDCRNLAVLSSTLPMRACDFSVFFNRGNRGPGVLTRMVKCDALFSGFSGIPRVPERLSDGVHNSAHSLSMTRAELSRQNPFGGAIYLAHGPVAQRLEQGTHNPVRVLANN